MKTAKAVWMLGAMALVSAAGVTWADQSEDRRGANVVPNSALAGAQALGPTSRAREGAQPPATAPNPRDSGRNEPASAPRCPRCITI